MAVAVKPTDRVMHEEDILRIPLDLIDPAADNPRQKVGDVDELAQSIRSIGLLEPLVATPRGDRYLLVCGARRHAAALLAGETHVPVVVREMDETQRILAMAIENLQRVDLSPVEEARAYKQLIDDVGMAQRDLAGRVGRSQGHISKRLSLLELPKVVVKQLDSGGITVQVGLELAKLAAHPDRITTALKKATDRDGDVLVDELAWQIECELAEVAADEKIAAARAKLEAAGVKILEPSNQYPYKPKGSVLITKSGGWDALAIDPAKHASEPCHGAMIDPRNGEISYYCTNRKNHPKLKMKSEATSRRASASPHQAKQREKQKKIAEAAKTRREFITETLVSKRIPQADLIEHVLAAMVDASHQEALKLACKFLDLEPPKEKARGRVYASIDYDDALLKHAAKGERQRTAVLVALIAGTHEEHLSSAWMSDDAFKRRAGYLGLLEKNGCALGELERTALGRKAASRKAA